MSENWIVGDTRWLTRRCQKIGIQEMPEDEPEDARGWVQKRKPNESRWEKVGYEDKMMVKMISS